MSRASGKRTRFDGRTRCAADQDSTVGILGGVQPRVIIRTLKNRQKFSRRKGVPFVHLEVILAIEP